MAKEFAKQLYNSKAWVDCRNAYFESKFGICELCDKPGEEVHHKTFLTPENINDPNITLNNDNLQLLCRDCHNSIHDKAYEMYRQRSRRNTMTSNGLCFDEQGNLVKKKDVFIVWGAPSSGKTTYVRENKGKHDIVIDIDLINNALSMSNEINQDAVSFTFEIRDLLYKLIEERTYLFEKVWIIGLMPDKYKRLELKSRLKAELIYIDTSIEDCLLRAKHDNNRKDKQTQYKIIDKYFKELQL